MKNKKGFVVGFSDFGEFSKEQKEKIIADRKQWRKNAGWKQYKPKKKFLAKLFNL